MKKIANIIVHIYIFLEAKLGDEDERKEISDFFFFFFERKDSLLNMKSNITIGWNKTKEIKKQAF